MVGLKEIVYTVLDLKEISGMAANGDEGTWATIITLSRSTLEKWAIVSRMLPRYQL